MTVTAAAAGMSGRTPVRQNYLGQLRFIWNMYLNEYDNRFTDDYLDHFNLTTGAKL